MVQTKNIGMSFLFLIIMVVLFLFSIKECDFMQHTVYGERVEPLKSLDSRYLPKVFTNYAFQNRVRYRLYKIPNYMEEFFRYNKEYLPIYKSGKKHTVLVFSGKTKNQQNSNIFYQKLSSELKTFPKSFNYLEFDYKLKKDYAFRSYNMAYHDLKSLCKVFCLVDPVRNTIFTFYDNRNVETDALGVLFQEYALLHN